MSEATGVLNTEGAQENPFLQQRRILLHVLIPGEPIAWERPFGANRFDIQKGEKKSFQWQLKAAAPMLKPIRDLRVAVKIDFYTGEMPITRGDRKGHFRKDIDNLQKFLYDASNGVVWMDDSQIDEAHVRVFRHSLQPRTEIMVYECAALAATDGQGEKEK